MTFFHPKRTAENRAPMIAFMQLMYNKVKCTIWLFCKVFSLAILSLPTFLPAPPSPPAIKTFPVMKFASRSMSPTAEICTPVALK